MLIEREIAPQVLAAARAYPFVGLVGPRQSGKTTLAKALFPDYTYVSLENLDQRTFAQRDPRGFLSAYPNRCIFDEAQKVPELFSYLQEVGDQGQLGRYILTGSQNFLLHRHIAQSRGLVLAVEAPPGGAIETDPVLLKRVVANLLKNAAGDYVVMGRNMQVAIVDSKGF